MSSEVTYRNITAVLRERTLEIGHLVPIDMSQTTMTLFQTLWELILSDPRQWWQSKHLEHNLSNLLGGILAPKLRALADERVAGLKETGVATVDDILERDERSCHGAVWLEISSQVFGEPVRCRGGGGCSSGSSRGRKRSVLLFGLSG
jgi:hypothetical protein